MIIIDILAGLAVLVLIVALVALVISVRLMLPVSEWLNQLFRRIGLAGPWRESRTVGIHGLGTVDGVFAVRDGDTVEIVYNDDLTVTVVRKPPHTVNTHLSLEESSSSATDRTES